MRKISKIRNTFTLAFLIWQCSEIISGSTINALPGMRYLKNLLVIISFSLLLYRIFEKKYKPNQLIIIFLVSILFVIADLETGYGAYLPFWLFLVAINKNDYEITMKTFYNFLLVAIPLVICLRLGNIIEDKSPIFMEASFLRDNFNRYALGFNHPNTFGIRLFELAALHLYVHRNKLKIRNFIFYVFVLGVIYLVPNCQAAVIIGLALLCISMFLFFKKKVTDKTFKFFKISLSIIAIICNVYSIVFGILGREINRYVYLIDVWASNRLKYAHMVFQRYGFSLFGTIVNVGRQQGADVRYLDNGYIAVLVKNGFFVYIVMTILIIYTIYKATERDILLGSILMLYAVDGIMTGGLWLTAYNPFNIIAGIFIADRFVKKRDNTLLAKNRILGNIYHPVYLHDKKLD